MLWVSRRETSGAQLTQSAEVVTLAPVFDYAVLDDAHDVDRPRRDGSACRLYALPRPRMHAPLGHAQNRVIARVECLEHVDNLGIPGPGQCLASLTQTGQAGTSPRPGMQDHLRRHDVVDRLNGIEQCLDEVSGEVTCGALLCSAGHGLTLAYDDDEVHPPKRGVGRRHYRRLNQHGAVVRPGMDAEGIHKLTARERDVLRSLGMGHSSKVVARELGLTIETVRSYTKSIYAALDIHNRAEAAVAAIEAGLVDAPGASDEATDPRHSIAAPVRAVIGREEELDTLATRLADQRLVSIVGIGGSGKTVLAREAARAHLVRSGDRGAFIALEHVEEEVGLAIAVAAALGVHLQRPGEDAWNETIRLAGDMPRLLVLDNFEHLVEHAGRIVELLESLPALRVLTTSREALGVAEETVVRLDGLSIPEDDGPVPTRDGAVELFLYELERLDTQRSLVARDLHAVVEICRRVDGLPLAVVLAAGWIDVMSLEDIASELAESSELLASESAVPKRHRSLSALVDQSIERRSPPEQDVLARLSVFDGGFDRDAATAVAGATLQRLASLIRGSLVRHDATTDRYDLHPLVRERASALLERQRQAEPTRDAHGRHYATYMSGLAEAMAGRPEPPHQRDAVDAFDREHDNIRAAWLHAVATGTAEHVEAMREPLVMWLDHRSDFLECETLLTAALESPVSAQHGPELLLHREYIRFQSGSVDPANCHVHDALEALESAGSDWLAPGEIITAFLEVAVLGRPEDAFRRVQTRTSPDAGTPPYWRHRGQMLLAFMLSAMGDAEAAVATHREGMDDAMAAGDHSAAHVQMTFVALGLLRVNRRHEIPDVLAKAEQLLALLPKPQTEASVRLIGVIQAAFDGEDPEVLERRVDHEVLDRIRRENQHIDNLANGVMALARGARGDLDAARRGRVAQDDDIAAGFFGESVLWCELGIALALAARDDLAEARAHAEAGRRWQEGIGLVTNEVDVVLTVVDAVEAHRGGDHKRAIRLLDEAMSAPSLLTGPLEKSHAVERLRST